MSSVFVKCPLCSKDVTVDDSWAGMELECPICHGKFILPALQYVPEQPVPPVSLVTPQITVDSADSNTVQKIPVGDICRVLLKIFLACGVILGGIFLLVVFLRPTPESLDGNQLFVMTMKLKNRDGAYGIDTIAKFNLFPVINEKTNFFYNTGAFEKLIVSEKEHEVYEGVAVFRRNGKKMERPVIVDRRYSYCKYYFPVNYKKNPAYLEEDGDLIFALACEINKKLEDWTYESGTAVGPGVLECIVSDGSEKKKLTLKVETVTGDDDISRIWVEFL